jgi:hypothetical protein
MRKFKTRRLRTLWFRWLFIFAGALMLLAAFAPRANAQFLIRFYDFEGTPTMPYAVNVESHSPAVETGMATQLFLDNGTGLVPYGQPTLSEPGLDNLNPPPGPPVANLTSIGFNHSAFEPLGVEIPMPSSQGIYDVTSVSFAYASDGNGWSMVQLQYSTDAGNTFTIMPGTAILAIGSTPGMVVMFSPTPGTTLNVNNLVLRLLFTGGQSNGANLQFQLDNIQINGNIVPEPATVAGGFLGVLGLCWFQRRRLIRSVRLRRT